MAFIFDQLDQIEAIKFSMVLPKVFNNQAKNQHIWKRQRGQIQQYQAAGYNEEVESSVAIAGAVMPI